MTGFRIKSGMTKRCEQTDCSSDAIELTAARSTESHFRYSNQLDSTHRITQP